jgi:hypothetical protein
MADFKEEMYIEQLDANTFSYCWSKYDLANDEDNLLIDIDWEQECTAEELYEALLLHDFDAGTVFTSFARFPFQDVILSCEY